MYPLPDLIDHVWWMHLSSIFARTPFAPSRSLSLFDWSTRSKRCPGIWSTEILFYDCISITNPLSYCSMQQTPGSFPILPLQFGLRLVSSATWIANECFHLYLKIALWHRPLIFNHCFDCPVVLFYNPILTRSICSSIKDKLLSIMTSSRGASLSSSIRLGKASLLMSFFFFSL